MAKIIIEVNDGSGDYVETFDSGSSPKCTFTKNVGDEQQFEDTVDDIEAVKKAVSEERIGSNPNAVPPRG